MTTTPDDELDDDTAPDAPSEPNVDELIAKHLAPLRDFDVGSAYATLTQHAAIGTASVHAVCDATDMKLTVTILDRNGKKIARAFDRDLIPNGRLWSKPGERGKVAHCTRLELLKAARGKGIGKAVYTLEGGPPTGKAPPPGALFLRWGAREIQMTASQDNRRLCFRWGFQPRYPEEIVWSAKKWKAKNPAHDFDPEDFSTYPKEFFESLGAFEALRVVG